jgi:hypothetical protein
VIKKFLENALNKVASENFTNYFLTILITELQKINPPQDVIKKDILNFLKNLLPKNPIRTLALLPPPIDHFFINSKKFPTNNTINFQNTFVQPPSSIIPNNNFPLATDTPQNTPLAILPPPEQKNIQIENNEKKKSITPTENKDNSPLQPTPLKQSPKITNTQNLPPTSPKKITPLKTKTQTTTKIVSLVFAILFTIAIPLIAAITFTAIFIAPYYITILAPIMTLPLIAKILITIATPSLPLIPATISWIIFTKTMLSKKA